MCSGVPRQRNYRQGVARQGSPMRACWQTLAMQPRPVPQLSFAQHGWPSAPHEEEVPASEPD